MGCQIVAITKAKLITIVSIWGVIMLLLLGAAYKARSPALYLDINLDFEDFDAVSNKTTVYAAYDASASNCFIAAGIYLATFVFGLWQWKVGQGIAQHTTIR